MGEAVFKGEEAQLAYPVGACIVDPTNKKVLICDYPVKIRFNRELVCKIEKTPYETLMVCTLTKPVKKEGK